MYRFTHERLSATIHTYFIVTSPKGLFNAKNSNIPTKHTQSRTENAQFQFCLTITEPFFSYLSRGNGRLFAPVHCNASINKSSASHFCPVRVRILWLLEAVNCLSLPFTFASSAAALLFPLPPFPVLSTSNSLKRGSISPSENRSDHLATRETAYVFLISAKNSNIPTKHTQSRTENTLFQFCLTITEPFFSYLSRGNERLLKSQRFTDC